MPLTRLESKCGERQKIIVCKENNMECRLENIDEQLVRQYKLDTLGNDSKQCDWLVLNDEKLGAYFIELKNSDIKKAIEQIYACKEYLKATLDTYAIRMLIIASGFPRPLVGAPSVVKFKTLGGDIKVRKHTLTI
jgi:hypothetical protein